MELALLELELFELPLLPGVALGLTIVGEPTGVVMIGSSYKASWINSIRA
jgi:hypothetical protein